MWVFLSNSFLSIVQDRNDHDRLLVRARFPKDIERVFPDAETFEGIGMDYRFRAFIPRSEVVKVIAANVAKIDYDNFKSSVKEPDRHDLYMDVWSIMESAQEEYLAD